MNNNITPKEYLTNLTDEELFQFVNAIDEEIKIRIISLFKAHSCTVVYIPSATPVEASVNNIFDVHPWKKDDNIIEKWVEVDQIGYSSWKDPNTNDIIDSLYVITKNGEIYEGDEINEFCLWDLYKEIKDILEE